MLIEREKFTYCNFTVRIRYILYNTNRFTLQVSLCNIIFSKVKVIINFVGRKCITMKHHEQALNFYFKSIFKLYRSLKEGIFRRNRVKHF